MYFVLCITFLKQCIFFEIDFSNPIVSHGFDFIFISESSLKGASSLVTLTRTSFLHYGEKVVLAFSVGG